MQAHKSNYGTVARARSGNRSGIVHDGNTDDTPHQANNSVDAAVVVVRHGTATLSTTTTTTRRAATVHDDDGDDAVHSSSRDGEYVCVVDKDTSVHDTHCAIATDATKTTSNGNAVRATTIATLSTSAQTASQLSVRGAAARTWTQRVRRRRREGVAAGIAVAVLVLLLVLYAVARYDEAGKCARTNEHGCTRGFGAVLGTHDGVVAYSNGVDDGYVSRLYNYVNVTKANTRDVAGDKDKSNTDSSRDDDTTKAADGVVSLYSGMMWQCVEYARRYWILRGAPAPATFGDVDGAEDIWTQLREVQLLNGTRVPLHKHGNGVDVLHGGSAPRRGDLLIYHREPTTMPYGHVAVIVGVDVAGARVYVAEQNWDSEVWPAPHHNYSRVLPLRVDAAAMRFTLVDEAAYPIAGWVRYGND